MTVAEATPELTMADHADRAFLGHPKGLAYLSFTEAWERFSYYGMQNLLVLYMVKLLLLPDHIGHIAGFATFRWLTGLSDTQGQPLASAIYGDYTSLVYATPFFGGLLADRLLGRRYTVLTGAILMAMGHFLMAFDTTFLFALLCLILGSGCFKGNIASQVGALYQPDDLRRADAFQIYYLGINIAGIFTPLVVGTLGEKLGWHYGFGAAGIGMLLALGIYLSGRKYLPADTVRRPNALQIYNFGMTLIAVITPIIVVWLVMKLGWHYGFGAAGVGMLLALAIYLWGRKYLPRERKKASRMALTKKDWLAVLALILIIPVMAMALVPNNQIFNAYLVWADERFDLVFFGWRIPTTYLTSIDAVVSISFLAVVALFYRWYGARRKEPDEITKMIIGSVFSVAGMLCLYMAAATTPAGHKITLFWPMMFELLNSIGFAHLLPVSLALFARMAPPQLNSAVIGLYYVAFFGGNKLVGWVGGLYSSMATPQFWLLHAGFALVSGTVFLLFKLLLAPRLMAGPTPATT